jgi:hypothetical protein
MPTAPCVAEDLSGFQEGLCSIELVTRVDACACIELVADMKNYYT